MGTIRVKTEAMYQFSTLEEAEAFVDFKKSEEYENLELLAFKIEIVDKPKENRLTTSMGIDIIPP